MGFCYSKINICLIKIINWVVRALNADWLTTGMTKQLFFTALILLVTKIIEIRNLGGFVIYGQFTTAKGGVQALGVASCLRTALSRGILAIYHTPSGLIA